MVYPTVPVPSHQILSTAVSQGGIATDFATTKQPSNSRSLRHSIVSGIQRLLMPKARRNTQDPSQFVNPRAYSRGCFNLPGFHFLFLYSLLSVYPITSL